MRGKDLKQRKYQLPDEIISPLGIKWIRSEFKAKYGGRYFQAKCSDCGVNILARSTKIKVHQGRCMSCKQRHVVNKRYKRNSMKKQALYVFDKPESFAETLRVMAIEEGAIVSKFKEIDVIEDDTAKVFLVMKHKLITNIFGLFDYISFGYEPAEHEIERAKSCLKEGGELDTSITHNS